MKAETLDLLRSPISHSPLRLASEMRKGVTLETLVAIDTGETFAIDEGIPALLDQSKVVDYNKKYQGFYNLVAPLYDATLALGAKLIRGNVDRFRMEYIRELELKPGDRFLEVSIGTGANLKYLPADISCYGVDISRGMLKQCRKKLSSWGRECELILGDAEELPFVDAQFDSVLHVGGINAFNDRKKAIAEMVRVAKPGTGIVIVDETAKMINKFSWLPGARRMMKKYGDRFEAPVGLLPAGVLEVKTREIVHGDLYCLSFRKPSTQG
jgi:ubiquinone/menaquinone biosynthesis C-methylase UbiE